MRNDQHRSRRHTSDQRPHAAPGDPVLIWGIHAVEAVLSNPVRVIGSLWLTDNGEHRLAEAIARRGVRCERVLPRELDRRLGPDTVHQGALVEVQPLPEPPLADLAEATHAGAGPVLLLDQVTDPHNVGAILRSAAVFGAAGLVMTRRHSPPMGGALAKAASGALELVPICLEQNLARALDELGRQGVVCYGLDGTAEALIEDEPLAGPAALVLGAEGRGLRQLTRERCAKLCRIMTAGPIESLNVSNAAAVSLHMAALARRRFAAG